MNRRCPKTFKVTKSYDQILVENFSFALHTFNDYSSFWEKRAYVKKNYLSQKTTNNQSQKFAKMKFCPKLNIKKVVLKQKFFNTFVKDKN